jgi:hypothetical protein
VTAALIIIVVVSEASVSLANPLALRLVGPGPGPALAGPETVRLAPGRPAEVARTPPAGRRRRRTWNAMGRSDDRSESLAASLYSDLVGRVPA